MNDNRKMILSHQAIDNDLDRQDRENMRQLIGLQAQRIAALESANAELRKRLAELEGGDE